MRKMQKLEDIPEWQGVRDTLAQRLGMTELQLRLLESEIEAQPFDSLDFVELIMALEQAFGISLPLSRKVDLAKGRK